MNVLVTAFEPFDGRNDNQSLQILKRIEGDEIRYTFAKRIYSYSKYSILF
jgi:pyrrolidone-carboxylate peptidase